MKAQVEVFKALSDENRLRIIDMLSCGELCACDIIEGLELTQPTVSHHMKILQQANLVAGKKKGKWMEYSLNHKGFENLMNYIKKISTYSDDCICHHVSKVCKVESIEE